MRNGMMKRAAALLLAATMTVPAYAVYAEDNTQIEAEAEAAEAEAKAEAERQAAEAAAQAEAERQAAEAAAQAEAERQAAEAAAQAEAERQAAEAAAQAEAEKQAAEAAAQAEAERQAAEAAAQTEAATEAQTEAQTEAAETEAQTEATEAEEYQTSFKFENDEVVIVVKTSEEAKLGKDTKLTAKKLEEGSEKYEAAKAATINSLGSSEEELYSFYEIGFEKDGKELDVQDSHMTVNVTFKNEASAVQVKDGVAKRL
ncbi:Uncharacterised protein [uncultured Clostridium sp.]|uniref:Uncharacterized protein n=1 Tax=Muricoprocola aceti TaxID=2981772 RepID=A0ABT2SIV8_9FIRM|nr:hypothetical protein [Muricoprocola aceti]MCU6724449.1 hypothetical protein [Muricoprocola aceti]SCH12801.1 Uncharacterised protein [uncultured Clostridium sp.]